MVHIFWLMRFLAFEDVTDEVCVLFIEVAIEIHEVIILRVLVLLLDERLKIVDPHGSIHIVLCTVLSFHVFDHYAEPSLATILIDFGLIL